MLKIVLPELELYDQIKEEFITKKSITLSLEHSLLSISKWESKWNKPFLSKDKTMSEIMDYVRCMNISGNDVEDLESRLSSNNIDEISEYIEAPMTATKITDEKGGGREIITSEIIYYWMIVYNIPFECQKWHLNRLITLIKVCNKKNEKPKKMSNAEIMARNRELNEQRKKSMNTKG